MFWNCIFKKKEKRRETEIYPERIVAVETPFFFILAALAQTISPKGKQI